MPANSDIITHSQLSLCLNYKFSSKKPNFQLKAQMPKQFESFQLEPIDFVKYDKSPMDHLKSKYRTLNSTKASTSLQSSNVQNSDNKPQGDSKLSKQNGLNQQHLVEKINNTIDKIDITKHEKLSDIKLKYTQLSDNGSNKTLSELHKTKSNLDVDTNKSAEDKSLKTKILDPNLNNLKDQSQLAVLKNLSKLNLSWNKIRKVGKGLHNLGNNCYLNATIQCLAYTPPLSQWLITKPHSPSCRFKQQKGFCSLCEVERIIYDIFNSSNSCATPNQLCFNIKKISAVFRRGTQEDASEFFTTLLESMSKTVKFALNNTQNCKVKKTILDEIFSFQFISRITCKNCGYLSDTIENTNTWPVDVKYVQDIRKGMLHFLREEVLEGENAYKCDKCNRKTRATKKYSIRTAPNILVVHLKRFDFSYAGKLSHFVTYPECLTIKTQTSDGQEKSEKGTKSAYYRLYGVLVHLGYTCQSGHYYSYVRGPNAEWYRADDERVINFYLMFYYSTRLILLI